MYNYAIMTPKISQIIRSNRKSFSLEVKPDGRLIVRAPKSANDSLIQAMVAKKADWIITTQARLAKQFPALAPKTFTPGEQFWYLGEKYSLQLTNRKRPLLDLDGVFYLSKGAQNRAKDLFIEWYREETRQITADLIEKYKKQYRFNVAQVRITSARTRWGSCSGKNNLNFTYRLSMAPLNVIDYVVVHELAHLKVRNHSKAFWEAVGAIKPDYQKYRKWLKENGALLSLD
jgi:predicted metal-dependent hydrolase